MGIRRVIFLLVILVAFVGVHWNQRRLNTARDSLGLTRTTVLENAPPVLAFTTVALGGFRGLIVNILWIRANELQEDGKYFEMVQLSDWITKLQPHFSQVWVNLAWNMAYNISVKFPDPRDRWLWVQRGIELLRDQGMVYNPHEVLMYRELAWFFQHKMGAYLDDAHLTYKAQWAREMHELFGGGRPDFDALIEPRTDEARARSERLRVKYKMDPQLMKEIDQELGPLEWRLPECHAIYWARAGLKHAKWSGKPEEAFIMLRRAVYQPMLTAFQRGRFITNRVEMEGQLRPGIEFGPNLDMIPNVSKAYEKAMEEDREMRDHIGNAHKNFMRDAVYNLFAHNRLKEAQRWFDYGSSRYGTNAFMGAASVEEFAMNTINENVNETSPDRVKALLEGFISQSLQHLAQGQDEIAAGEDMMASIIRRNYLLRLGKNDKTQQRVPLPTIPEIKQEVLRLMLNPTNGMHQELQLVLRSRLGLPAASTNAVPVGR